MDCDWSLLAYCYFPASLGPASSLRFLMIVLFRVSSFLSCYFVDSSASLRDQPFSIYIIPINHLPHLLWLLYWAEIPLYLSLSFKPYILNWYQPCRSQPISQIPTDKTVCLNVIFHTQAHSSCFSTHPSYPFHCHQCGDSPLPSQLSSPETLKSW